MERNSQSTHKRLRVRPAGITESYCNHIQICYSGGAVSLIESHHPHFHTLHKPLARSPKHVAQFLTSNVKIEYLESYQFKQQVLSSTLKHQSPVMYLKAVSSKRQLHEYLSYATNLRHLSTCRCQETANKNLKGNH